MKKITMLLMSVLVVFVLAACGTNDKDTANNDADENLMADDERGDTTDPDKNQDNNENANDAVDNGVDHNGESRLDLAEDVADKVAELDEVDNATVILSNRNAYVAVVMDNDSDTDTNADANDSNTDTNNDTDGDNREDELSKDLEEKISDKVREVKTDVDNVYVSLNPEFVERMRDYGTRIQEGEPIEGFFEEFGEAVRNVFPDAN